MALLMTTLGLATTTRPAAASLTHCRSDPVVLLSDGTIVDVSADISTFLTDVIEINYTLHIPSGLSVLAVVTTPNWPTTIERFEIYADNPAGRFTSTTIVHTQPNEVAVTAQMLVTRLTTIRYATDSGYNSEQLQVWVRLP